MLDKTSSEGKRDWSQELLATLYHIKTSTHLIFPVVDQKGQEDHSIITMLPSTGHIWQNLRKEEMNKSGRRFQNKINVFCQTVYCSSLTCKMASKMLLIITYSSMVFWLMLSVTCGHIFHIFVMSLTAQQAFPKAHRIRINTRFLTVTRQSSSLRQRLFRLSEPSPQRRLSSLSIRSCRHNMN